MTSTGMKKVQAILREAASVAAEDGYQLEYALVFSGDRLSDDERSLGAIAASGHCLNFNGPSERSSGAV
ncbi:hypothetical protein [Streptomyces erythrochromogenes]|uniref:hypothetical protein n=1 Tax=Streptomyces erythrochromogenes TaxID=285574 RepID=UPI0036A6DBB8